jgi:plastocyanin
MTNQWLADGALAIGGAFLLAACGGSPSNPSTSTTTTTSSGGGNPTVTITASGVSPNSVTVSPGSRVTFFNNDSTQHTMNTDPHPDHTGPDACPEINNVGFLVPGQRKETGNLNTVRTCTYHDHNQPSETRFQGRIVIQ